MFFPPSYNSPPPLSHGLLRGEGEELLQKHTLKKVHSRTCATYWRIPFLSENVKECGSKSSLSEQQCPSPASAAAACNGLPRVFQQLPPAGRTPREEGGRNWAPRSRQSKTKSWEMEEMGRKEHDQSAQERTKRVSRASRNAKVPFSFFPVHKLRQHLRALESFSG